MPAPQPPPLPEQPSGPKVSILIVSWNCAPALRRCLHAINHSKRRDATETIVIDCGSHDGCERIDSEFPWITPLRLPRNFGKTRARNIGVRTAKGEYILLLDPNVELSPPAIDQLAEFLSSNDDCPAASAELAQPDGKGVELAYRLPDVQTLKQVCETEGPLPQAPYENGQAEAVRDYALLVRKVVLKGMNYFEEKRFSEHWADLEMCFQVRNAGKKFSIVQAATGILYPAHPSTALDGKARALLTADRIGGAANYVAKHHGMMAGFSFRLGFILSNMFSFPLFTALVTGQRIDGTQDGVLA